MKPVDPELIEKCKRGDKDAFGSIFEQYHEMILGFLVRYVRNYHLAEDITVTVFLKAFRNIKSYEEQGTFTSWLYRIAVNCAKSEFKRKRYKSELSLDSNITEDDDKNMGDFIADDSQRPDHAVREIELKELIYKLAVTKLKPEHKDAYLLCDVEGLSYEEAAKTLKTNTRTIGTWLSRARKKLFELLLELKVTI